MDQRPDIWVITQNLMGSAVTCDRSLCMLQMEGSNGSKGRSPVSRDGVKSIQQKAATRVRFLFACDS